MTDKEKLEKIEETYKMLQDDRCLSLDEILKLLKEDTLIPPRKL